jgi:hypothetical protein
MQLFNHIPSTKNGLLVSAFTATGFGDTFPTITICQGTATMNFSRIYLRIGWRDTISHKFSITMTNLIIRIICNCDEIVITGELNWDETVMLHRQFATTKHPTTCRTLHRPRINHFHISSGPMRNDLVRDYAEQITTNSFAFQVVCQCLHDPLQSGFTILIPRAPEM